MCENQPVKRGKYISRLVSYRIVSSRLLISTRSFDPVVYFLLPRRLLDCGRVDEVGAEPEPDADAEPEPDADDEA